jgi:hypothetical protein
LLSSRILRALSPRHLLDVNVVAGMVPRMGFRCAGPAFTTKVSAAHRTPVIRPVVMPNALMVITMTQMLAYLGEE